MLQNTLLELEKEYVIENIHSNSEVHLSKVDLQMIEYFLTTNSNLTAKDLATTYNSYNDHKRLGIVIEEKIIPLIEKGVFVRTDDTKSYIDSNKHNFNIELNKKLISINKGKVKHLKIDRYL